MKSTFQNSSQSKQNLINLKHLNASSSELNDTTFENDAPPKLFSKKEISTNYGAYEYENLNIRNNFSLNNSV